MDIEEKRDDLPPEAQAMLSPYTATMTDFSPAATSAGLLTESDFRNTPDDDNEDETYDGFDLEDEIPDFSSVRPASELDSPLSEGQCSLGLNSSISDRSDNSRTALIQPLSKHHSGKMSSLLVDNKRQNINGARTVFNDNDKQGNALIGVGDMNSKDDFNKMTGQGAKEKNEDEDDNDENNICGIGPFRPPCFRACANVKMFVVFMCLLQVVATALSTGYLNSVITTIEKRFEIGSSISGLIAAAYELGNLVSVIFVSYLGASRHIPKLIGCGVIVMGVGSLLFSLPHVIAPKYTIRSGVSVNESDDDNICRGGPQGQMGGGGLGQALCISQNSGNWGYVLVLVAAQILIGTGGSPIMTLGVTYVDSHVVKEKAPTYLAFIHASGALGPVLGYALGALLLQFYVDTFSHDVQLTPSSPRWIGAWWGGFIVCGLVLVSLSVPFLAYPRTLVREKRRILEAKTSSQHKEDEALAHQHEAYGKSVKEIPKAVLHLLRNPVYAVLMPAICCEISIVSGFVVFLPKYLESQFGTSTSLANLFTGGIGIPGAVLGILIGGYLMKKLALTSKGAVQFVLLLNTLAISGFTFFFFLGCDNLKIAGANFPYFNSTGHKIFEANLTSSCNQNCACSPNHLQPICGINGITYFSPCHAGCTGANFFYPPGKEEKSFNYSGCSCIQEGPIRHSNLEVIISPLATSGACKNRCEKLLPFLILLVVVTFCVAGAQMPLLMVTLRSVGSMERSFALGLQFVCMRLFAYIPSPIFFGQAIDNACLLWSQKCGANGSCLLYDIVLFRYSYVGIAAGLKVISLCFFVALWFFIRRRDKQEVCADIMEVAAPLSENQVTRDEDLVRQGGDGMVNGHEGGHKPGNRPSHLSITIPVPIPEPADDQTPWVSHSAPIPPPVERSGLRHLSEGHEGQEVMVMTPGSSHSLSMPLGADCRDESVL